MPSSVCPVCLAMTKDDLINSLQTSGLSVGGGGVVVATCSVLTSTSISFFIRTELNIFVLNGISAEHTSNSLRGSKTIIANDKNGCQ